jgi:hypothetical protein
MNDRLSNCSISIFAVAAPGESSSDEEVTDNEIGNDSDDNQEIDNYMPLDDQYAPLDENGDENVEFEDFISHESTSSSLFQPMDQIDASPYYDDEMEGVSKLDLSDSNVNNEMKGDRRVSIPPLSQGEMSSSVFNHLFVNDSNDCVDKINSIKTIMKSIQLKPRQHLGQCSYSGCFDAVVIIVLITAFTLRCNVR